MIFLGEDFEFKHGVAPGREDQAGGAIIAIGNHKCIAGSEQALGDMAKCAALYLQHDQIKIHAQTHQLRMNGIFAIREANLPAAEYVVWF